MRKRINWDNDEVFIQNYLTLKSSYKMAEMYNCSRSSITNHCKDINFDYTTIEHSQLSEDDKKKIVSEYETKTSAQLAKEYGVTRGVITKIWYDAHLKGKSRDKTNLGNNLVGRTFGYLTVIALSEKRMHNGSRLWLCVCNCGHKNCLHTKEIAGRSLLAGYTVSCGTVGLEKLNKFRINNFKDITGMTFGKLQVIERDTSRTDYVVWKCVCECGNETYVISENLLSGNTQSCGLCSNNSHGNIKIEQILKENNIDYVREKRFDSCRDKFPLPFDFYVNNQYCIEYDGKQHYNKNTFFRYIKMHDSIKSKWCKDNNIPLIRIPYTHYDELCLSDLLIETSCFLETNADIKSQD
jgi:hypothetical protein